MLALLLVQRHKQTFEILEAKKKKRTIAVVYPVLKGLDYRAREALLKIVHPSRVSYTLQNKKESAGMHLPEPGTNTTAAADLYVGDLSESQIHDLLDSLGRAGFAAWYRTPGRDGWPALYLPHVHAVYAGVPLKAGLRVQVRDYLNGKNGLRSHQRYRFHTYDPAAVAAVRQLYLRRYGRR
jgi:hypothetical protein